MARILIADREPSSFLQLALHLSERGHVLECVDSLAEAKHFAERILPQIVICEYQLGDGTLAPTLCDDLRRMAPATEFIVCTARPLEFVMPLCEAAEMRGHYFKKPCDPEMLTWVIEGVICAASAPKRLAGALKRRVKPADVFSNDGSVSDLLLN